VRVGRKSVIHVGRERIQRSIEEVLGFRQLRKLDGYREANHLHQYAAHNYDCKHVGTDVRELIVPRNRQLKSHPKSLRITISLVWYNSTQLTLIAITETLPTNEQIERYTIGFFVPWVGTTLYIMYKENIRTKVRYNRNARREKGSSLISIGNR
jgi:hypothetical protein